jgi:CO/xanthine dehydrogenase FAD-binding subunit
MQWLTLPVKAAGKSGRVALTCTRMKLGDTDESGRPRPVPVEGSEFTAVFDAAIKATGEEADTSGVPKEFLDKNGRLSESDCRLGNNIFAGGDCVSGPSTVVRAIAAGRKAAEAIDRYLGGKGIPAETPGENAIPRQFDKSCLRPSARIETPERPASERVKSLTAEDSGDPKTNDIREEAGRCFNCGCLAVNSSDMAPVLIALDAGIKTTKRAIEAEKFFTVGVDGTTVLDDDEIVTGIDIPAPKAGTKSSFIKFALRGSIDFPIVNCAAAVETVDGRIKSARICLNAVYNTPYRAYEAEKYITGKTIDEQSAEAAGDAAVKNVCPLPDNTYKIQIARTLVKRALLACIS